MIWRRTASNHLASIAAFPRMWLGWGLLDRLIPITFFGWIWCAVWFGLSLTTQSVGFIALVFFFICPLPWVFWVVDAWIDNNTVKSDVQRFLRDGAILATRCEYLGGHPYLPHGRFVYLLLEGTKQNPNLTAVFPGQLASAPPAYRQDASPPLAERFLLPILDLAKMKQAKGSDASPAADIATAINSSAGRVLRPERLTFVVDYDGAGGRKHKVEFTNFFHGNNEIRNWQNYIVCAQAQADSGIEPHAPWVTLPDEPIQASDVLKTTEELELNDAFARNGHEERQPSSAFQRR